jgi:hypothetical protein
VNPANAFDGLLVNPDSFSYRDLTAQDKWTPFDPSFTSLTVVGSPTYTGRFRIAGKWCQFQVTLVSSTSVESTAGTTYFLLPITARGIAGLAAMSNNSTNIPVGLCHINTTTGRCYLPTHPASNSTFSISGSYEI